MIVAVLSALAEPTLLAAMRCLADGRGHCVCEPMRKLSAIQSRMSRRMHVLKPVGLVVDRRDGQWVRYRINPDFSPPLARLVKAARDREFSIMEAAP